MLQTDSKELHRLTPPQAITLLRGGIASCGLQSRFFLWTGPDLPLDTQRSLPFKWLEAEIGGEEMSRDSTELEVSAAGASEGFPYSVLFVALGCVFRWASLKIFRTNQWVFK